MIDLDDYRQRAERLRLELESAPKTLSQKTRTLIASAAEAIESLVREVEDFRQLCEHRHLVQVFDEQGQPTDAHTCVNCHQTFSRKNPIPDRPA